MGLECNIGMAANPDAAMHAACGFNGITVIPAGRGSQAAGRSAASLSCSIRLTLRMLAQAETTAAAREREKLREQMLDTLERWGVRDFRTLALLPEHALASRLGEAGTRLQQLSRGAGMRTLALCEPPAHFEEAMELESAVETLESLSFLLNRLLDQLCARLEARALAVQELKLRLQLEPRVADEQTTTLQELADARHALLPADHRDGNLYARTLRLPVAMRDPKVFPETAAIGLGGPSAGSARLQTMDRSRAGSSAFGATRPVFARHSRSRKAGDHARAHHRQ